MNKLIKQLTVNGKRLNPLIDCLFLKVMGEKGDEEQLLSFINAVLGHKRKGKKITSIEILEGKAISPLSIGDKASVLDVLAKAE